MTDATPTVRTAVELVPAELVESARRFASASRSANTARAYRSDWRGFACWCRQRGLQALPAAPETVALYLTARAEAGAKVSTLTRSLAAISEGHKAAGHDSPRATPAVRAVMQGIRRSLGVAPAQKAPLLAPDIKALLQALPEGRLGLRDRALLLVGFLGGLRRSELVGLELADVAFAEEGLELTLRRSKTDPEAAGRKLALPNAAREAVCPVRALRAWLEAAGISEGPVFRAVTRHGRVRDRGLSAQAVALVVKRAAAAAGLDPARLAGHSLRAGFATAAAKAGKSERAIMAQTGHRSVVMVRRYIRDADLFADNAAAGLL